MPLRLHLRRRARSALRRALAPLVRGRLDAAEEASALRAEIESLDRRIDELTAHMRQLVARLEEG